MGSPGRATAGWAHRRQARCRREGRVMQGATYGEGGLELRELPEPRIRRPDDILLRVVSLGICGSDLRMVDAPGDRVGNVFGHEFSAIVAAAGPQADLRVGQAVVVNPNLWCQACWFCRSGAPNLCDNLTGVGSRMNGGAANMCVLPARLLHPVPPGLDLAIAALAEPLSCVIRGLRRVADPIVGSVLILGGGPIGLLALLVLRGTALGPIALLERHATRAEAARSLGADAVFASADEARQRVVEMTAGRGVDLALDASGGNIPEAVASVRKGGAVLALGYGEASSGPLSESVVTRELRVFGSFTGAGSLPAALEVLAARPSDFARVISHRMPLTDARRAIDLLRSGAATKVILQPEQALERS
jgi:threonine dehydrogenase-like Zn-dependent dehydrogenase